MLALALTGLVYSTKTSQDGEGVGGGGENTSGDVVSPRTSPGPGQHACAPRRRRARSLVLAIARKLEPAHPVAPARHAEHGGVSFQFGSMEHISWLAAASRCVSGLCCD
jgi:hypothetical protein